MEPEASYQTLRLSRGKHASPGGGACVMELASMLAGEPFTDQPQSVCPVIAGFMRAYNDACDDRRRQDLIPFASAAVGTRGDDELTERRADACMRFTLRVRAPRTRLGTWLVGRRPSACGVGYPGVEAAGVIAARALRKIDDAGHAKALAFIDELISMGGKNRRIAGIIVSEEATCGAGYR